MTLRKGIASLLTVLFIGTGIIATIAYADDYQVVTTWSHIWTGIQSEFEAGHYGTGDWGTDPTQIVTQCWAACQDGANAEVDIDYSIHTATTDIGRYAAKVEHINAPWVTTYKYYGWIYD